MIYTVSTVKDNLANVKRFVERNLSAGVDMMFIFSEDVNGEAAKYLSGHDFVVHVPSTTHGGHWRGDRPANLHVRQKSNANLVRTLATPLPWATWLFHIDGDEILHLDREELESLSPDIRSVQLQPLEAVAAMQAGWEHQFKYPLQQRDLGLLCALGVIREPKMTAYFNGQTVGKAGVRPSLDYYLDIHYAKYGSEKVEAHKSETLKMLHYHSNSAEEFARKWMALLANEDTKRSASRKVLRMAVEAVGHLHHLPEGRRAEILHDLYRIHVADDVELLSELGYLVCIDDTDGQYTPRRHSPEQLSTIHELLKLLTEMDHLTFDPARGRDAQRAALEDALARASDVHGLPRQAIAACGNGADASGYATSRTVDCPTTFATET